MDISLFCQGPSDRIRGNVHKLHQKRFTFNIRKNVFIERIVKHWNSLPRGDVKSPSLGMLSKCVDMSLEDMF